MVNRLWLELAGSATQRHRSDQLSSAHQSTWSGNQIWTTAGDESQWSLEALWGNLADKFVPVPQNISCPQELEAFTVSKNGERTLGLARAWRLYRFIFNYLKMNNFQQSADEFSREANVIEKVGDGDGLLARFWIPCMIEKAHAPQDPVIPPVEPPFNLDNLDEDNVIPQIEPQFNWDEDNVILPIEPPVNLNEVQPSILDDFLFEHVWTVHKQSTSFRILTCHFSTDGKYLAFAGREKRVFLWDVETRRVAITLDLPHYITDVRFHPECHMFAAACYDGLVRCWETVSLTKPPHDFSGHTRPVLSLDFSLNHPNILCSCDIDGEVRVWDIASLQTIHQFKVGGDVKQLRMQSKGDVLAAVVGKQIIISLIKENEEGVANINQANLEGHVDVKSICWDNDGRFLASVSHDMARIWELVDGTWNIVYELASDDFKFESCVFHPIHPQLLIIGSYTFVHIWDFTSGSRVRHVGMRTAGFIASLASSPAGFVALTNRSGEVNLWR